MREKDHLQPQAAHGLLRRTREGSGGLRRAGESSCGKETAFIRAFLCNMIRDFERAEGAAIKLLRGHVASHGLPPQSPPPDCDAGCGTGGGCQCERPRQRESRECIASRVGGSCSTHVATRRGSMSWLTASSRWFSGHEQRPTGVEKK